MQKIAKFFEKLPVEYHCLNLSGYTYILMFLPYRPNLAKDNQIFIDNYYAAYQKIFRIKQSLIEFLIANGYKTNRNTLFYKKLALLTGKVKILKSTLTAHPQFGSFFAIEVVKIEGELGDITPQKVKYGDLCATCNLCKEICPTNSIDNTFDASTCIRNLQNRGYIAEPHLAKACYNRVWGCNLCQLVCPYNEDIYPAKSDTGLLDASYMFDRAKSGRAALLEYEKILGKNYLRPTKLLSLVINAMTNTSITTRYEEIKKLASHLDERVKLSSLRYLDNTKL